jgi:hypothetical protein
MITYKRNCIIVDLDGTVALENTATVLPKGISREEWDEFHQKVNLYNINNFSPIYQVIDIINSFYKGFIDKPTIIFLTAREDTFNGKIRSNTEEFIRKYFNCDYILLMRKQDDFREDKEIKEEFLLHVILPNFIPIVAFDDKQSNIKMFQKHGITSLKVYIGDNSKGES